VLKLYTAKPMLRCLFDSDANSVSFYHHKFPDPARRLPRRAFFARRRGGACRPAGRRRAVTLALITLFESPLNPDCCSDPT
jgi:hypothetical protein